MNDADTPARAWREALQKKLMDAIDAAWAMAENSDDPAVIAKARDKARLAGQMAAEARKIVALVPPPRPDRVDRAPAPPRDAPVQPEPAEPPAKAPAAQAAAMQAALARMGRRR
jgi:hypothetical protein